MEPQPSDTVEVFYSYSHKDEDLRDQLESHLSTLKREGVIKGWHDRRISAGQEWDGKIDEHLNSADIILLLVSSDFLASPYCYDIEVTHAMERHEAGDARVIPIILRSCDWTRTPFAKLQALPKDAKPVKKWEDTDDAFLDIAKGIRKAAVEVSSIRRLDSTATEEVLSDESLHPTPARYIPDMLRVDFVHRKDSGGGDIVERLKDELAPSKKRLNALWGFGGVGKTAIAAEVARGLSEAFAQRVVWASADGRADFSLSTLLDEIATQLKQPDLRKLTLELKREQVRELVQEPPTLIVLDNFETIAPEEAKPCVEWLAQPALCAALITTRDKIEEARNFPLNPMLLDEARTLLQRLISQAHDPRAFANLDYDRVIGTAEANPLVLQWIFGQIDLAQDPNEVLDDLKHGEGKAAERVFDRSFNLKQLDKGGRAVLLALSLFVPSATRKALAEVSGLSKDKNRQRFKDAVKTLSALWLIRTTDNSQRLAVEGLTRELTKTRLSRDLSRATPFRQRLVYRFLCLAEANSEPKAEHLNAIEAEKDNILSAINVAFEMRDWRSMMRIRYATKEFLTIRGYWDEALRSGEQALGVARDLSDKIWIAFFTHDVAAMYQRRGDALMARRLYGESLQIKKQLGDQLGIANTLHNLAMIMQAQGEVDEARRLCVESLEINKKLGDQNGVSASLEQLGSLAQGQGEIDEARRLYGESLEIRKRLGDQRGVSTSLHLLGILAQSQGALEEARRLYGESLEINKKFGDQNGVAISLHTLASLVKDQGEINEARRLYGESLEIKKRLGDQRGIAASLHQLGTISFDEGELDEAENLYSQSLNSLRKLGHKQYIAECLESIGNLRVAQNTYTEARGLFDEALQLAEAVKDKFRIASIKRSLGLLAEKENEKARAVELLSEALRAFKELKSPKAEETQQDLDRLVGESS